MPTAWPGLRPVLPRFSPMCFIFKWSSLFSSVCYGILIFKFCVTLRHLTWPYQADACTEEFRQWRRACAAPPCSYWSSYHWTQLKVDRVESPGLFDLQAAPRRRSVVDWSYSTASVLNCPCGSRRAVGCSSKAVCATQPVELEFKSNVLLKNKKNFFELNHLSFLADSGEDKHCHATCDTVVKYTTKLKQ